jgi:hemerythrin-like domain-containing protein
LRRIPQLRDLSDDHHTSLVLARRCKQGPKGASVDVLWDRVMEAFEGHLEPHFAIEERHLLPALETIGEAALAERIRKEHRELRALRDAPQTDAAALAKFGRLLEAHVRFEERQVFEATQHRLPPAALRAIEAACETVRRVCPVSLLE